MTPLVSRLVNYANSTDDPIAIIAGDKKISYKMLAEKIFSAASKLLEMGVSRGDRVMLSASNTPSFIYGYFATHLLGAIAVPIDPHTPESRIKYFINIVTPKVIFFHNGTENILKFSNSIEKLDCNKINNSIKDYSKLHEIADIMFTTGTTGDPKGVILTHKNIASAANNINRFIKNTFKDREVVSLPLSHSFGLGRLRCILLARGTIILNGGFTFPGEIFLAIEKWRATGLSFVPAGFAVLYKLTGESIRNYKEQLKYIEIGSAPMPIENKKLGLPRIL
jgi:long-chain acyl-CoA synthetase